MINLFEMDNPSSLDPSPKLNFYSMIHETIHLLGFNENLFQYYITE